MQEHLGTSIGFLSGTNGVGAVEGDTTPPIASAALNQHNKPMEVGRCAYNSAAPTRGL